MSTTIRGPDETRQRIVATTVDVAVFRRWGERAPVIELELGFGGHLDQRVLLQAGDLLLDVEPILGCRLVDDQPALHWEPLPKGERNLLTVARDADEYERIRCTGLHATDGAQVALCLWPRETGDRLLVKMTHIVGDGAGLRLLVDRLGSLYSALKLDPEHRPGSDGFRDRGSAQIASAFSKLERTRAILDFAWFMAPRLFPRRTHSLSLPHESEGPAVPVIRRLPAPRLSGLARYGRERGATVNDVFLAAAYRALAFHGRWDGTSALRIPITVDLRRWCLPTETPVAICNLSSFDFPYLIRDLGRSFDETLANVSALTRRRKRSRPGLALALIWHRQAERQLCAKSSSRADPGPKRRLRAKLETAPASLTFSNEGLLEQSRLRFAEETPICAHILPSFVSPPALHISLSGYDGGLTLTSVTAENGRVLVGDFLDALIEELPGGDEL